MIDVKIEMPRLGVRRRTISKIRKALPVCVYERLVRRQKLHEWLNSVAREGGTREEKAERQKV